MRGNKMPKLRLLISAISFIMLIGCHVSPYRVYDLAPADKNMESMWLNGKELVKLSGDKADIIVNYDTSDNSMLIFDLSVLNKTTETILISPTDFSCKTNNRLNEVREIEAIDPELKIKDYNKKIEKLRARSKAKARDHLVFSIFEVVDNFTYSNPEEKEQAKEDYAEQEERRNKALSQINSQMQDAKAKRQSFEIEALRKTSLIAGNKIGGKLYFPVRDSLTEFSLVIPIGQEVFVIPYAIEEF
jgi:hypothetical protein